MNSTFDALERALSEQKWGAADSETRELICRLSGEPLPVTPEIIDAMGEEDLQRIDALWGESSQGLFGLSVQANLWIEAGGPAEVYVFEGMSREQKLFLGEKEREFARLVGWPPTYSLKTMVRGCLPYEYLMCSYGLGLTGFVLAAVASRFKE